MLKQWIPRRVTKEAGSLKCETKTGTTKSSCGIWNLSAIEWDPGPQFLKVLSELVDKMSWNTQENALHFKVNPSVHYGLWKHFG